MGANFRILITAFVCAIVAPVANAQDSPAADEPVTGTSAAVFDGSAAVVTPITLSSAAELAQIGKPAGPPPTPAHTGVAATFRELATDFRHLPSKQNLFWVGVGSGLALAVHPADDTFNGRLSGNKAHNAFAFGAVLGQSPTLLAAAGTVYVVGRVRDEKHVSHVGSDLLQSIGVAEGMTQVLKYATRRERPDGSGANSFPSGHAADTFAFATALERHLGWKGAVPAYAFSTYVAMSRLHDNRHYLSDVAFGSAVGIIAGRTVTRHGRSNYTFAVAPVQGGGAMFTIAKLPANAN
jgi:membrane-associated phospholipid phosphatase